MPFIPADIKAVIFDMDGLLLDSEVCYRKAVFDAADELGLALTSEVHLSTIGVPADGSEKIYKDFFGPGFDFKTFDDLWRLNLKNLLAEQVPVKPKAPELLRHLNASKIPAAVATSTGRTNALAHLEHAGIIDHFETIVTRDDVTNGKPNPEPFLTAAARLNIAPNLCLALEDSHNGVRAAAAAGMVTVMVPDLLPPTDEMHDLAKGVVPDLGHILAVFEGR